MAMHPVDVIAQAIRKADGNHTLGAGRLGEVAVWALEAAGYEIVKMHEED